jgi:hypothetical protein
MYSQEEDVTITPPTERVPSMEETFDESGIYIRRKYDEEAMNRFKKDPAFKYIKKKIKLPRFKNGEVQTSEGGTGAYGSGGGGGLYTTPQSGQNAPQAKPYPQASTPQHGKPTRVVPPPNSPPHSVPETSSPSPDYSVRENPPSLSWIWILLASLALVGLILYFLGFKSGKSFTGSLGMAGTANDALHGDHLENRNLETELEAAIRMRNYKLAVRIIYLDVLKDLNAKQMIHWQKNKTNMEYVSELKNDDLRPLFKKITNSFEYVWYGDFSIDESTFKLMQNQMHLFKTKL